MGMFSSGLPLQPDKKIRRPLQPVVATFASADGDEIAFFDVVLPGLDGPARIDTLHIKGAGPVGVLDAESSVVSTAAPSWHYEGPT